MEHSEQLDSNSLNLSAMGAANHLSSGSYAVVKDSVQLDCYILNVSVMEASPWLEIGILYSEQ